MTKAVSAYDLALRFLEFRARSEAELRSKLLQKGVVAAEIDEAITRLRDQKLLDDAEFARQFARNRTVGAGASRRRVVQELRRKGVAGAIAGEAVDGLQEREGIDPDATVHRVAGKKWKSLIKLDEFTRRRRLYAFLARRGFDPDEIRSALKALESNDGLTG